MQYEYIVIAIASATPTVQQYLNTQGLNGYMLVAVDATNLYLMRRKTN